MLLWAPMVLHRGCGLRCMFCDECMSDSHTMVSELYLLGVGGGLCSRVVAVARAVAPDEEEARGDLI